MGLRPLEIFVLLQCGDRLWSSESDVYRRQILTTKVDPRTVRVKEDGLPRFEYTLTTTRTTWRTSKQVQGLTCRPLNLKKLNFHRFKIVHY